MTRKSADPPPDRRPWPAYLHPGAVVVVPASVAAWLTVQTDMPARRVEHRGADPQVDAVLGALTVAGLGWRTRCTSAPSAPGGSSLDENGLAAEPQTMSTSEAAEHLGITPRAIRLAIAEGRLPATRTAHGWVICAADLDHLRRRRAA